MTHEERNRAIERYAGGFDEVERSLAGFPESRLHAAQIERLKQALTP